MPLYEYACPRCEHHFEALVKVGEVPPCPSCGAKKPERLMSAFAVSASGADAAPAMPMGCGTCGDPRGPGACRR